MQASRDASISRRIASEQPKAKTKLSTYCFWPSPSPSPSSPSLRIACISSKSWPIC